MNVRSSRPYCVLQQVTNNLVPLPVLQGAVCGGPNASKRMTDTLCTYILINQAELEASQYDEHLHLKIFCLHNNSKSH